MKKESDVHPHVREERAELFQAENAIVCEQEVGALLYALVRCLKPEKILETGTGFSTMMILQALQDNGVGGLVSIDKRRDLIHQAAQGLAGLGRTWAQFVQEDSIAWIQNYQGPPFDFAFLDSDVMIRAQELQTLIQRKLIRGHVLIHDTSRHRSKTVQDNPHLPEMLDALNLRSVESNLSRGWRLFQVAGPA